MIPFLRRAKQLNRCARRPSFRADLPQGRPVVGTYRAQHGLRLLCETFETRTTAALHGLGPALSRLSQAKGS